MKCCYEAQGGRLIRAIHEFPLPTTALEYLLCAQHGVPEARGTRLGPGRAHAAGPGADVLPGVEPGCGVSLWEVAGRASDPGPASYCPGGWASA